MSPLARQRTLRAPVTCEGVGVHTGVSARVEIQPADPNAGLRLVRADVPGARPVPVTVQAVVDSRLATVIGGEGWRLATVEHLLAALVALGVDNALVVVAGPEVPVLDGSARPWVTLLEAAGLDEQPAPRRTLVLRRALSVADGPRRARLLPAPALELAARVDYPHPAIGRQSLAVPATAFSSEIAWARTFAFQHEVDAMRAAGLALGGSLDNALVYGPDGPLNPEGPRAPDEPVRHKLLDMLGDLALAGVPVRARFEAELPGHALNARLIAALLAAPEAWQVVEEGEG